MSILMNWLESLHVDAKITNTCSRKKHLRSTCTACLEVCKDEAISITNNSIELNLERCTSCGECMIVCPLSAIAGIAGTREFDKSSLIFNDHYTPSVKELLIYKSRGLTSIIMGSGDFNQSWEMVLKETNQTLQLLDQQPIEFVRIRNQEGISRRVFFASLQKEGKQLAKNMAPAIWKQVENEWNLASYYPDYQFHQVEISHEKCTLCQMCQTFCSQNVITKKEGFLLVENEKCVNCLDCTDICTEHAIQIKHGIQRKKHSKHYYYTKKCQECGQLFNTFQPEKIKCSVCNNRDPNWLSPYD